MSKAIAKRSTQDPARISTDQAAETFTRLYMEAVAGTRAHLVFGAAYEWLGAVVASSGGNPEDLRGTGLKGWIEENCPKVNYKTAHKWYTLAKGIKHELGIPKSTNLYRLLTAPANELTPKEQKIRREIDDAIEGKSAHQLEIFTGIRKEPKMLGEGNQNAVKDLTQDPEAQLAAAKLRVGTESGKAVQRLGKLIDAKSIAFLGLQGMRLLAEELERLAKLTRDVLAETAKGARP